VALASGLFESSGEARRAIQAGGLSINDERPDPASVDAPEPIAGEWLVVRFGKRRLAVGRRSG
jgi:tyrosyl-tRNA synthetase